MTVVGSIVEVAWRQKDTGLTDELGAEKAWCWWRRRAGPSF